MRLAAGPAVCVTTYSLKPLWEMLAASGLRVPRPVLDTAMTYVAALYTMKLGPRHNQLYYCIFRVLQVIVKEAAALLTPISLTHDLKDQPREVELVRVQARGSAERECHDAPCNGSFFSNRMVQYSDA